MGSGGGGGTGSPGIGGTWPGSSPGGGEPGLGGLLAISGLRLRAWRRNIDVRRWLRRLGRRDGRLRGLARLRVSDRGPGLPDFARDRVFERFYSLPRPDGARSSGLGLNLVREVALLHGGSASLDNREGGGAVAELRLPLR